MAAAKKTPANQAVEQPAEPATHAWMVRADLATGEVQRVEVDIASGSVEVMEALGWAKE